MPTLWFFITLHTGFVVSLFTDKFISGVQTVGTHGYWSVSGDLFKAYTLSYVTLTITSITILYRGQRAAHALQKTRVRAMLLAIVCIWVAGTNDMLPIHFHDPDKSHVIPHIEPLYPIIHVPFFPLGSVAACLYMTIVAYSVLQHTLLDVHVTLSRMVAHFIRVGFILLIGLCQLLLVSALSGGRFTDRKSVV